MSPSRATGSVDRLVNNRQSRRSFMRRAFAAGLAMPVTGVVANAFPAVHVARAQSSNHVSLAVAASPTVWDLTKSDWVTWQGINPIYDTLLELDDQENVQPGLAKSWEVSSDGLTYTFWLQNNVVFHDDTPFNAAAVKYNIERHQKRPDARYNPEYKVVERIDVVDDYTVKVVLNKPQVDFLYQLSTNQSVQVSPAAYERLGDRFGQNPVGTGAFKFKAYEPDSHIDYVRHEKYWKGAPKLESLRVRIIPEANVRLTELQAKTIDVVYSVDIKDVKSLQDAGYTVERRFAPGSAMLSLNTAGTLSGELAVRRAVARAIDRDTILSKVLFGLAEKSRAGVPTISPYYTEDVPGVDFNPDEAGRILDEAGWKLGSGGVRERNGQQLVLNILSTDFGTVGNYGLFNQIIQDQLKDIGVEGKIISYEWGTYLDHWRENRGDWHISYHSQGLTQYSAALSALLCAWSPDAFWNICQIRRSEDAGLKKVSEELLSLKEKLTSTADINQRKPLAKEVQRLYQENQLTAWLWHLPTLTAVNPRLKDYQVTNQARTLNLQSAWIG